MSVTVLVMTDGRTGYLADAITSLEERVTGPITRRILHDDTGDPRHRQHLARTYPQWDVIGTPGRSGFGGAYRHAYDWIVSHDTNPWLFSAEDDFEYVRDVDLDAMAYVLDRRPNLTQMALRRQAWNHQERAAGGVVEANPRAYTECSDMRGHIWLEHRAFHTTNPSLVPRRILLEHRWPTVPHSEGVFAACLFADPKKHAAYWGARDSGPWVTHIGDERVGRGY